MYSGLGASEGFDILEKGGDSLSLSLRSPLELDAKVNQLPTTSISSSGGSTGGTWGALDPTSPSGIQAILDFAQQATQAAQAAAAADVEAVATGAPRPSDLDTTYAVQVGSELTTGEPLSQAEALQLVADEPAPSAPPIGASIAAGRAGDIAESLGIPRGAAPYILGGGLLLLLAEAIKRAND